MKRLIFNRCWTGFQRLDGTSFETVWHDQVLKQFTAHRTSDVALIEATTTEPKGKVTCFRKRYWYPDLGSRLKGFFRNTFFGSSRVRAEFRNLMRLHACGLSQVQPIAYGEDRVLGLLRRAFLLTESLDNTCSLTEFLTSHDVADFTHERRKLFLCAFGRWVAALHGRGFRDRDLFARNVLVHHDSEGWRFSKIDSSKATGGHAAPGMHPPFIKDLRDLDSDLAHLLSRSDRLRCLLAYAGAASLDAGLKTWLTREYGVAIR